MLASCACFPSCLNLGATLGEEFGGLVDREPFDPVQVATQVVRVLSPAV